MATRKKKQKPLVAYSCAHCGKTKETRIKRKQRKFCSDRCRAAAGRQAKATKAVKEFF